MKEQNKCGSQIWKVFSFPVVLASASPRRRDILNQIGIEPVIMPSQVEEHITSSDPEQIVKELSWQKAWRTFCSHRCGYDCGGRRGDSWKTQRRGGRETDDPADFRPCAPGLHRRYHSV